MIQLEPQFALAVLVALMGAAGSFFAIKYGGAETQRLVKALHTRFDSLEKDVQSVKINHARMDERINALKESQRFRLRSRVAAVEADEAGEAPMFREDDGE